MAGRAVMIPGGSHPRPGYLAQPHGTGPWPGVIVLHEIFGLNDDIREKADRIASMGYAALAPDLLDGLGPAPVCMVRLMRALSSTERGVFADIEAARTWLGSQTGVDPARTGVAGFCMGGSFALLYAARAPLRAAAVFYGAVPKEAEAIEAICPVVAGYGARDRVFRGQGERLRRHLESLGVAHDWRMYDSAGHSYMSAHRGLASRVSAWGPMKVAFDAGAAADSWKRMEAFFAAHLG